MSAINLSFESFSRPKKVTIEMSIEEAVEVWSLLGTSTTGITLELFEKLNDMFSPFGIYHQTVMSEKKILEVAESYKISKTTTYDEQGNPYQKMTKICYKCVFSLQGYRTKTNTLTKTDQNIPINHREIPQMPPTEFFAFLIFVCIIAGMLKGKDK